MKKKLYEEFHAQASLQKRIISDKNFTYRLVLDVVNDFIKGGKKSILDIGCGVGTLDFYLAKKGNKVLGIDISNKAISLCLDTSKKLNLLQYTSFKTMSFPNEIPVGQFDFVICSEVIEHLRNDDLALKKISSLLKPGGVLILSTPSENAPLYKLGLATAFDKRVGHLRRYNIEALIKMCKKNGFIILQTRKTEGILRNFLYLNPMAGRLIRFLKFFIADIVTVIDNFSIYCFGESQLFVIAKKI